MTIFSLGSACDLEHFSNNTKLEQENFDMPNYQAPVVPMPTEPPNAQFGDTNYQWKSNSSAVQSMTKREMNSNTFNPSVGGGSQNWGSINFGPDYWGEGNDSYNFKNKLLNNSGGGGAPDVVMPNMRPQSAFMPPSRGHIVQNEDMNGRDIDKKQKMKAMLQQAILQKQQQENMVKFPPFNAEKIETDTKNLWFFMIFLLVIVVGSVMYKSNYF